MDGVDIVCFGTNVVGSAMLERRQADNDYYTIKYQGQIEIDDNVRLNTNVAAWNKVYSLEQINTFSICFPEGKLYEDYEFYWKYISLCSTGYFIQSPLYNYLRREGSIMYSTFNGSKRAIEHMFIYENTYKFIKSNPQTRISDESLTSMFVNCFWFAYLNSPDKDKHKILKYATKQTYTCPSIRGSLVNELRNKEYSKVDVKQ